MPKFLLDRWKMPRNVNREIKFLHEYIGVCGRVSTLPGKCPFPGGVKRCFNPREKTEFLGKRIE